MKIIYPTDTGIAVIHPCACGLSVEDIAQKDVPTGKPYLIVDDDVIPSDRTLRDAWTADFSSPDGVGA